ncbi:MAG: MoaD/ThiS family protein [Promethearchaeota archaeon]
MSNVKVTFLSPLRKFSKEREFEVEFKENETFGDLINKLVKMFGSKFKKTVLDKNNKIHDWVNVMKDAENIASMEDSGFSELLKNGQDYVFYGFISGG